MRPIRPSILSAIAKHHILVWLALLFWLEKGCGQWAVVQYNGWYSVHCTRFHSAHTANFCSATAGGLNNLQEYHAPPCGICQTQQSTSAYTEAPAPRASSSSSHWHRRRRSKYWCVPVPTSCRDPLPVREPLMASRGLKH